jgi:regulatory protein
MATVPPALIVKGRALRLLSQREHSRVELERKLSGPETDADELARALDDLQAKGFISEARVVESVVHRRATKLGTARVKQELQAKGLSPEAMGEALEQLRGTELARAREVWRKKFGEVASDTAERAKHMRFLATRGFNPEAICQVVRGTDDDEESI